MPQDLASIWFCVEEDCDERGHGSISACDKAAEKHGKTGHCTATMSVAEAEILTRALKREETHG